MWPINKKRTALLELLRAFTNRGGDSEVIHGKAEKLLLELVDDAEITMAWEDAASRWWYA